MPDRAPNAISFFFLPRIVALLDAHPILCHSARKTRDARRPPIMGVQLAAGFFDLNRALAIMRARENG